MSRLEKWICLPSLSDGVCARGWRAQCSNHSTQRCSSEPISTCSEATVCSGNSSVCTSRLVIQIYIKHIRNVGAVFIPWLSAGDSKRNLQMEREAAQRDRKFTDFVTSIWVQILYFFFLRFGGFTYLPLHFSKLYYL